MGFAVAHGEARAKTQPLGILLSNEVITTVRGTQYVYCKYTLFKLFMGCFIIYEALS